MIPAQTTPPDRSFFHQGGRTGFLLIHGLGGTPVELRYVAQGLARAGYTVYCCQLAGHCGTADELRWSTWKQWYASVEAAHDRLRQCCDTIIAGGLSMGGVLALHLAHQRPQDVHGLALYAPSLRLDGWSMPWYACILRMLRPFCIHIDYDMPEHEPHGIKDERIRKLVVSSMQSGDSSQAGTFSTPVRIFAQFNQMAAMIKRELKRIKTPTLILHPRHDDMADLGNTLEIQRKLSGPVESVILNDSYHIITLDRQRQLVVDRSVAFATRLEARQAHVPAAAHARNVERYDRYARLPVRQTA